MLFFDWENAFVRAKNGMHKHTNQSYLTWKFNYIQIKPLQFAAAAAAAPDKYPTLMFVSRSKSGELFCGDIWEDIICVYTTFYGFIDTARKDLGRIHAPTQVIAASRGFLTASNAPIQLFQLYWPTVLCIRELIHHHRRIFIM